MYMLTTNAPTLKSKEEPNYNSHLLTVFIVIGLIPLQKTELGVDVSMS